MRLDTGVAEVTETGVQLANGEQVDADVVVTGIGVRPAVDWLSGSGIALDTGVVVDEHLRTSLPGIYALGDVAVRWSPRWNTRIRVEHWDDAREAARTLAGVLLHDPSSQDPLPVHDPVPYFWSDQFGLDQYVGHHSPEDTLVIRVDDTAVGRSLGGCRGRLTAPEHRRAAADDRRAHSHRRGARPDEAALRDPQANSLHLAGVDLSGYRRYRPQC